MLRQLKHTIFLALSIFLCLNVSANENLFSIEKLGIDTELVDSWRLLDEIGIDDLANNTNNLYIVDNLVMIY